MTKQKVAIVGDIHGDWDFLNNIIKTYSPDIVLCCGDFGWWPRLHGSRKLRTQSTGRFPTLFNLIKWGIFKLPRWRSHKLWSKWVKSKTSDWLFNGPFKLFGAIKNGKTKIYFCPGNHEDWDDLDRIEQSGNYEVMKNVFYMPKGETFTLEDGRNVLFFGGAESIDIASRTMGFDWFPQEVAKYDDLYRLDKVKGNVDIVISHTSPSSLEYVNMKFPERINDPTRKILNYVLETFKPSLWYFGHYHDSFEIDHEGCHFTCLDMIGEKNDWTWIR